MLFNIYGFFIVNKDNTKFGGSLKETKTDFLSVSIRSGYFYKYQEEGWRPETQEESIDLRQPTTVF